MNKIDIAKQFCIKKHEGQKRKYTNEPYHVHPFEVMAIVRSVEHDENMLIAALLHDTVEDTDTTLEEIELVFGNDVANLVSDLTDVSTMNDGNRSQRKKIDLIHTSKADARAKTIKLADLISNTQTIVKYDYDFAIVYMREKRDLLTVLKEGNEILYKKALAIVCDFYNK